MMNYDKEYWSEPCPKVDCKKKACECGLVFVSIPAVLGDDSADSKSAPKKGAYCNAVVFYEANNHIYIYSKEGIPVEVEGDASNVSFDNISGRPTYDGVRMTSQTVIPKVPTTTSELTNDSEYQTRTEVAAAVATEQTAREDADTALSDRISVVASEVSTAVQPDDIDKTVMSDIDVDTNGSTSIVQLDAAKINLKTGATSSKNIPLPVASSTQAGVLNSATFDAITNNTSNINALLSGSVAVAGLSATPTQADLTNAWRNETGLSELINRAQVLDIDNGLIWTYYTNDQTWHSAPAGGQLNIGTFTNSSEGLIKGSTTVGQVFAENDGTGSINGWDTLSADVANNKANKLATTNLTVNNNQLTKTVTGTGENSVVELGFANQAINHAIMTEQNIAVANDTPAGWAAIFGYRSGVYVTRYSITNSFANQPTQYGFLVTTLTTNSDASSMDIWQRWHTQASGWEYFRSGNHSGWGGNTGVFRRLLDNSDGNIYVNFIADNSITPAKINWNQQDYHYHVFGRATTSVSANYAPAVVSGTNYSFTGTQGALYEAEALVRYLKNNNTAARETTMAIDVGGNATAGFNGSHEQTELATIGGGTGAVAKRMFWGTGGTVSMNVVVASDKASQVRTNEGILIVKRVK